MWELCDNCGGSSPIFNEDIDMICKSCGTTISYFYDLESHDDNAVVILHMKTVIEGLVYTVDELKRRVDRSEQERHS